MKICIDVDLVECPNASQILSTVRREMVILIVGEMSIEYTGRASSYAPNAYRLLIVKPDGALLVHESTRVDPLNWQPPRSVAYFECIENKLKVKSVREDPHEEVIIEFSSIDFIKVCDLASTKLTVIGRESDIVRVILMNPSVIEDNAVAIGSDVPTTYGKIDVLLRKDNKLIVVEVKNEKAGVSAVVQLKRYVEFYANQGQEVEGVLVAPDISRDALALLNREGYRFIDFNTLRSRSGTSKTLEKFFKMGKKN
ncbi:MAG: endonuclease NucS [Ignisphaera sp.]|uniref:Endonuclease NucS n=1 Tax=Ignisphaera aggregans TaxID=334771 RepID=A0A7C4JJL5_9CREN